MTTIESSINYFIKVVKDYGLTDFILGLIKILKYTGCVPDNGSTISKSKTKRDKNMKLMDDLPFFVFLK